MSLRVFHIVFIVASILLSVLTGAWGIREFVLGDSLSGLVIGLLFIACGFALVLYASKAFVKLKEIA